MPWGDGGITGAHVGSAGGFGSGGFAKSQAAPAKKKSGGGLLHSIGHTIAQTGSDLEGAAVGLGPGLVHLGRGVVHDIKNEPVGSIGLHNPFSSKTRLPFEGGQTEANVNAMGRQTAADLRHPLRHPGNTLLDVLSIANGVAKVGEAGAIAGRTGSLAKGVKALNETKPEARFATAENGAKVEAGTYSRSALGRVAQKGADRLREKHPDSRLNAKRVGKQRFQNERVNAHVANFDSIALLARRAKLNKAQELAIRVVNERVPLQARLDKARADAAAAKPGSRVAKQLHNHIVLLERVGNYVHDVNDLPVFRDTAKRLPDLYSHAKRVADKREADLIASGDLDAAGAAARKAAVPAHYGLHDRSADFFASYRHAKAPKTLGGAPQVGVRSQIGVPKKLEELNHEFTGAAIDTGNFNPKTLEQVGTDAQRANKFLAVWRQRHELGKLAVDYKKSDHHIPIRPIWLKNKKWPEEIRQAIQGLTDNLTPEDELSRVEKIREYVFPKMSASVGTRVKGLKWIDARYVGDLNLPRTLGAGEKIARVGDRVNSPFRALTLFRPGYIPPNLANNVFLNLIHGSAGHLAQASRLASRLGKEETAMIDALMGEGKTISAGKPLRDFGQHIQRTLSKTVDVIPRRAAFLHEADRFGYSTPEKVRALLTDEIHRDDLRRVAREANAELIDYGNLTPTEQALVRRLLFLYPWVKGATVYGGRFLREHPMQAGAFGQTGQIGQQDVQQALGDMPSYARGLVPVGGSVVNTEPFNNLPQAAQSLQTLIGLGVKNPEQRNQVLSQLSPVIQALLQRDAGKTVESNLTGATLLRLAQEASSPNASPKKVYPQSREDALLRFLLGSAAPRKINLGSAHQAAARERTGH